MISRVGGLGVGVKVPELVPLPPASPHGSTLPSQGRLFLGNLSQLYCSFLPCHTAFGTIMAACFDGKR